MGRGSKVSYDWQIRILQIDIIPFHTNFIFTITKPSPNNNCWTNSKDIYWLLGFLFRTSVHQTKIRKSFFKESGRDCLLFLRIELDIKAVKVRVKGLIKSQCLFGQQCKSIAIHWIGGGTAQMIFSEMKVWVEEEEVGMRREKGEEEMARERLLEEEEHVLISVTASVMIYQV